MARDTEMHRSDNYPTTVVGKDLRLFINLKFWAGVTDEEGVAVLAHETLHMLLGHLDRETGREHSLGMITSDLEINDDLAGDGWKLTGSPVYAENVRSEDAPHRRLLLRASSPLCRNEEYRHPQGFDKCIR